MPIEEERFRIVEYDLKQFKMETVKVYQDMVFEITRLKGLAEDSIKRLMGVRQTLSEHTAHLERVEATLSEHTARFDRVDTRLDHVDTRLDRVETRLDRMETLLTQILARLPGQSE